MYNCAPWSRHFCTFFSIFQYITWPIVDISLTIYLRHLVYVVFGCPQSSLYAMFGIAKATIWPRRSSMELSRAKPCWCLCGSIRTSFDMMIKRRWRRRRLHMSQLSHYTPLSLLSYLIHLEQTQWMDWKSIHRSSLYGMFGIAKAAVWARRSSTELSGAKPCWCLCGSIRTGFVMTITKETKEEEMADYN